MHEKVNLAQLKDISEGDREFEEEIIEMYLEDTRGRIDTLNELVATQNWLELRREAHTLKGSSGNIGVTCTFQLCKKLESASLDQDSDRAQELLNAIIESTQEVALIFQAYLAKP